MKEISTPEQQPALEQPKTPADLRAEAETRQRLAVALENMSLSAFSYADNKDYFGSHGCGSNDKRAGSPDDAFVKLGDYMNSHNYTLDDFDTYSKDPEWQALQKEAFPDYDFPQLKDCDDYEKWSKLKEDLSLKETLDAVNPNYDLGSEWNYNCQRCVPTFEMRARGYNVTALPCYDNNDHLASYPFDAWTSPEVISASGDGRQVIENKMNEWGNGARAQITVYWDTGLDGHTFVAEQVDGKTNYYDPQTGEIDCSYYFKWVEGDSVQFCRIDNLEPSEYIRDCCEGVEE